MHQRPFQHATPLIVNVLSSCSLFLRLLLLPAPPHAVRPYYFFRHIYSCTRASIVFPSSLHMSFSTDRLNGGDGRVLDWRVWVSFLPVGTMLHHLDRLSVQQPNNHNTDNNICHFFLCPYTYNNNICNTISSIYQSIKSPYEYQFRTTRQRRHP